MKTRLAKIGSILTCVAMLAACTTKQQAQTATAINQGAAATSNTVDALPPALVTKVKNYIAVHPTLAKYNAEVATALNVAASDLGKAPSVAELQMYMFWIGKLPASTARTDLDGLFAIYQTYQPELVNVDNALGKLAALVKTRN